MAIATSSRGVTIARTFASAFAALADFARVSPAEAASIAATVYAHLRSAYPQATLIDTGPIVHIDPEPPKTPAAAIKRLLHDNDSYQLVAEADCVVMTLDDGSDDPAIVAFTSSEIDVLLADLASVRGAR